MQPSSIDSLRLMSSVALQVAPLALAVIIGAYMLSAHLGVKPAADTRVVVENEGAVLFAPAAEAIAAAHEAARTPAPTKPTFEPRQRDVAAIEPAEPAPPARARAMRQASAKYADSRIAGADNPMPLPAPPPLQLADAALADPVAEPQPARVLGVPVPRFVTRTSEKVVNVADAIRPSRLISASWEFSKQAANKAASAAGAIVP